ncbi:uncharacterized protein [Gossypium hirsutum]|uniref:SWIM-type domain-containing protein n=1 Tax=Gossypium hirsutum TaxID=3635 RepID=A0ABM2YNQ0_GOSHI|nr:uncharacterized protein LOC121206051 [Gossypium hirsutum]
MGSRREATSAVTSTLMGLIDDNFNENEENMSGSDVSGSEVSGSDSDASERVTLDGLNMDGIGVDELCDSDDSGRRAKLKALELIEGAHKAQYEKIYEYLLEVRTQNEGTTTICYLDNRLFQRMYVCLQACKDGYRAGCRGIVGLDGCFLKGYYSGYLLAAVGIDANNGIYPLAYAAVESENQASWFWFLELLAMDLEIVSSYHISFTSDKQKGLLEAIYLLWKAARASTTREFDDAMDELRKTNHHAYDWLKKKNPAHWSRSHFSIRSHSNMLVNNLSESFNKVCSITCCGDKYQVECGLGSRHVVDLVQNSCSYRNWDLTGIPCMHALAIIHEKNEFPETYVQTWHSKQTQIQIYSNFVSPVKGPKQWASLSNMLPILPPPLRRPPGRPTKVRRKEPDEP